MFILMEPHFLSFRSCLIKYYTCGEGDPLILIHGYQTDSRIWNRMIPLLRNNYKLIIPDLPGHGYSPLIQATNTMDFLAEVIYGIAFSNGCKGVSLVGHSMGGYVALAFAQKHPNMTDSICLINSHSFEDSITKSLNRNREAELILDGRKELLLRGFINNNFSSSGLESLKEEVLELREIALSQPENGMLADLSGMMARTDKTKLLLKSRFEIDFIMGSDDEKFPTKKIKELSIPRAGFHYLNNCGHMCILEKPEETAAIINK